MEKSVTVQNKDTLEEVLKGEKDPEVKRKLSFISLVAGGMEVKEAVTHFGTCTTTGYRWVRHWNSEGLEGLRPKRIPGRPARLDEKMLERLKSMLEIKPYWILKEVRELIRQRFGVDYSDDQVRRISVEKLGMNYAEPFVRDYRRPKDAKNILFERVEETINNLRAKGYPDSEMVIGFLDEASPQTQANTVRVLSFGKPRIFKNTAKIKANAMGYYRWEECDILSSRFEEGKGGSSPKSVVIHTGNSSLKTQP